MSTPKHEEQTVTVYELVKRELTVKCAQCGELVLSLYLVAHFVEKHGWKVWEGT